MWSLSEIAFAEAAEKAGVTRFAEASFRNQPDISVDYAVMEKAEKVVMVPAGFGWSDVGSWDAVADARDADADGNSVVGAEAMYFIETQNTHVESSPSHQKGNCRYWY